MRPPPLRVLRPSYTACGTKHSAATSAKHTPRLYREQAAQTWAYGGAYWPYTPPFTRSASRSPRASPPSPRPAQARPQTMGVSASRRPPPLMAQVLPLWLYSMALFCYLQFLLLFFAFFVLYYAVSLRCCFCCGVVLFPHAPGTNLPGIDSAHVVPPVPLAERRQLAMAMALHPRLGKRSPLRYFSSMFFFFFWICLGTAISLHVPFLLLLTPPNPIRLTSLLCCLLSRFVTLRLQMSRQLSFVLWGWCRALSDHVLEEIVGLLENQFVLTLCR